MMPNIKPQTRTSKLAYHPPLVRIEESKNDAQKSHRRMIVEQQNNSTYKQ
jgi:hypothetical protein